MRQAPPKLIVRQFAGLQEYAQIFAAMRGFTEQRDAHTADELWLLQHDDVYTQGQAGKPEHLLHNPQQLPVIQTDRGGQITWHGAGQLVAYPLFDLRRLGWNVRELVSHTESILIEVLAAYNIPAHTRPNAPGVYVGVAKIGSLGFKIRKGCSYHGLSLNIDCHLTGFAHINPCGFRDLSMLRLCDLLPTTPSFAQITQEVADGFLTRHAGIKLPE